MGDDRKIFNKGGGIVEHNNGQFHPPFAAIITPALTFIAALLTGCTSCYHLATTEQAKRFDGGPRPVYVINPEMRQEYRILKASRIFQLTNQPQDARLLTLHPMESRGGCGLGVVVAIYTCGIVPGEIPGNLVFRYELDTDGAVEEFQHHLLLYERVSLWEWFWKFNQRRVFAKALATSVPQPAETSF